MYLPSVGAKSPRKNPVDHSSVREKRVGRGRPVPVPKGVLKTGATDQLRDASKRYIHIEVAGKHYRRLRFIPLRILQCFFQLSSPEPVVPSAFEMQIVGNDRFAPHIRVCYKREPATHSQY